MLYKGVFEHYDENTQLNLWSSTTTEKLKKNGPIRTHVLHGFQRAKLLLTGQAKNIYGAV